MNSPHLLDSVIYYLTDGVIYYAKRETQQTIHAGIQANGSGDNARGTPAYTRSDEKV